MRINLLPWREKKRLKTLRRCIALCISYISLVAFAVCTTRLAIQLRNRALDAANQHGQALNANYRLNIHRLEKQRQRLTQLTERLQAVNHEKMRNKKRVQILFKIADWLPDTARLEKVSIHQQKITLSGYATSYDDIAQFLAQTKRYEDFSRSYLIKAKRQPAGQSGADGFLFVLEASWK